MIEPLNHFPVAALGEARSLFELGLIIVLATIAPLIAQVLRVPSILLLLALGFGAGAFGALDPNALLGKEVVSAVVSISVGIILFESGLDLKVSELKGAVSRVYRRLVTIGILVTWAIGTVASYFLFGLSWEVALVLGAVLVVSGPTVVGPLLEFIRPSKTVGKVLKWEGTLADPIGATLGVIVFQAVVAGQAKAGVEILEFLLNIGVGVGLGVVGAAIAIVWGRWFRPSQGQAFTGILMIVVAAVVAADLLRDDSGLLTGLTIGAILVNRAPGGVESDGMRLESAKLTRAWREQIAVTATFLIGILFIILSARVSPADIADLGWIAAVFVAVLVVIGRPLAVALSTLGSSLKTNERAFIAWMAPRGIVAAATSSTFALGLESAGVGGGAEKLIPITFVVIVATALLYGLTGAPVAKALGVSRTGPGGVLIAGQSRVALAIASALKNHGIAVVVWASNEKYTKLAEDEGLTVFAGDPTAGTAADPPPELENIENALIVTGDDGFNAIIAADLGEFFGRNRVYQLATTEHESSGFYVRARILFDESATHEELARRLERGPGIGKVQAGPIGQNDVGGQPINMFVLSDGEGLRILTAGDQPELKPGEEMIGLPAA
ncbi:MAG: cation:proton antiporter [Solirubrobacterales bacterium]